LRLYPQALLLTALLASTAGATTPPNCGEELAKVSQVVDGIKKTLDALQGDWRQWLVERTKSPAAPSSDSVQRWVFALRAWNRLTPTERHTLGTELGAALASWDTSRLEALEQSISAYQLEIQATVARLTPLIDQAKTDFTTATT